MTRIRCVLLSIFVLSVNAISDAQEDSSSVSLTEEEFRRLHKMLQPAPNEPWRSVPWKIALVDAQQRSVEEHKPIFIWAMDGHPLGCT